MYPNYVDPRSNNTLGIVSLVAAIISWLIFLIVMCLMLVVIPAGAVLTLGIGAMLYFCVAPFLCLPPVGWIIGIVTGHLGLAQIRESGEAGEGMAKGGLISSYVGMGLVVLGACGLLALALTGATLPVLDQFLQQ